MSSLTDLAPTGEDIVIGGKTYRMMPMTALDRSEIEHEIKRARGDPIDVVRRLTEGLSPEQAKPFLETAYDDAKEAKYVTVKELNNWSTSLDGACFQFWLSIRRKHPEVTREDAVRLMEQLGEEQWASVMEATAGLPDADPTSTATASI